MKAERISRCRLCGSQHLEQVVDLGEQALSGHFPMMGQADPPCLPLELVQCKGDCGLVQLSHDIPMEWLYGPHYGYLSGLNTMMKQHLEAIVEEASSLVTLEEGDMVVDIGSNDGTLLKAYRQPGLIKLGFDEGHFSSYYRETDIQFLPLFFSKDHMIPEDDMAMVLKPKVITSIAMFYDVPDPDDFVADIKEVLHVDGIWIVEQLYLPGMVENTAFDSICHEHLMYYGVRQMMYLLKRHGLRVFNIDINNINGSSFQLYICHEEADREDINRSLYCLGETEQVDFIMFTRQIQDIKRRLYRFLKMEKDNGKTIHLYGASTKANVLLQYCGIDYRICSFAAERNPMKYGCRTPGTHIPIMSEVLSRSCHPDYYLVGPWHFRKGFLIQMKDYIDNGGSLVFPLPTPEVVDKDGVRQI